MKVFERTISSIVDENFLYARALDYLGVDFCRHSEMTLTEVCRVHGLQKSLVVKSFYLFDRNHRLSFQELSKYPIELVLEYLRHSHQQFIKERLPFISKIIHQEDIHEDLKLIFPHFVEDFIGHIYEEEDTLFRYISKLIEIRNGALPHPILWHYRSFDMRKMLDDHKEEDELNGIRALMEELPQLTLSQRVVFHEVKSFDREMLYHAEIENSILFPKALELENAIMKKADALSKLN